MKQFAVIFLLIFVNLFAFGQYKIVKIDSQNFYLRFFYKTSFSKEIINDSVYFKCQRITDSSFYLSKFVNKKKEWTRRYSIVLANDSLGVKTAQPDSSGETKVNTIKQRYYYAIRQK